MANVKTLGFSLGIFLKLHQIMLLCCSRPHKGSHVTQSKTQSPQTMCPSRTRHPTNLALTPADCALTSRSAPLLSLCLQCLSPRATWLLLPASGLNSAVSSHGKPLISFTTIVAPPPTPLIVPSFPACSVPFTVLIIPSDRHYGLSGKESASAGDTQEPVFDPWVGKIPWRRKWQPIPVFLPGKSHGQESLEGYSPWGCKESNTTRPCILLIFLSTCIFVSYFTSCLLSLECEGF